MRTADDHPSFATTFALYAGPGELNEAAHGSRPCSARARSRESSTCSNARLSGTHVSSQTLESEMGDRRTAWALRAAEALRADIKLPLPLTYQPTAPGQRLAPILKSIGRRGIAGAPPTYQDRVAGTPAICHPSGSGGLHRLRPTTRGLLLRGRCRACGANTQEHPRGGGAGVSIR